jgi:hypothetical protein
MSIPACPVRRARNEPAPFALPSPGADIVPVRAYRFGPAMEDPCLLPRKRLRSPRRHSASRLKSPQRARGEREPAHHSRHSQARSDRTRRDAQGCVACSRRRAQGANWRIDGPHFLGQIIQHAVLDPRDGRTLLARRQDRATSGRPSSARPISARPGRRRSSRPRSRSATTAKAASSIAPSG